MWLVEHLLSLLIFLPMAGAVAVLFARGSRAVRWTAFAFSAAAFLLSLSLLAAFHWSSDPAAIADARYAYRSDNSLGVVQLVERADWIKSFNVQYLVGIDGLSLPLVLLTTFISLLACVASWNVATMGKGYFALLLLLETAALGTFLSLDLFLFFVFFEASLLPVYFLVGVWGGPRKEYAAIKFLLYALLGSVCLLIALGGIYRYTREVTPSGTSDLIHMASRDFQSKLAAAGLGPTVALRYFVLLMVAFLAKVPAVPLHTWLPDAHSEATTPVSMALGAMLLNFGGYGLFRVAYPLFPYAGKFLWLVFATVGVVCILYGALCAMAQTDFKKLVAYSSVSTMGFVVLGAAMMAPMAVGGALFMMTAHGITSVMLFYIVGVVEDRAGHRDLRRLGGLGHTMPIFARFGTLALFASLGLPGLCNFVGEMMVLLGSFEAARPDSLLARGGVRPERIYFLAVLATLGIVLTAGCMLWTLQRVFLGLARGELRDGKDASRLEVAVLAPLAIAAFALGIGPGFLLLLTGETVSGLFKILR